jgi:hypothetical protein
MAVTKDEAQTLKEGQELKLTTHGYGGLFVAKVIPVGSFGSVACPVEITEIIEDNSGGGITDGDLLVASYGELEILPE